MIAMDLDVRSGFFEERLQTTVAQLSTAFDERVAEFTDAFDKRSGSLDTKLIESLTRINETLSGNADSIEGILNSNIERLGTSMRRRTCVNRFAMRSMKRSAASRVQRKKSAAPQPISAMNSTLPALN